MRKQLFFVLAAAAMILAACGAKNPAETPAVSTPTQGVDLMATVEALQTQVSQPAVEPTQAPVVEPTSAPVSGSSNGKNAYAFELDDAVSSENGLPIREFYGGRGNIPESVVTIKVNTTGGCTMPEVVCYMLDNEGVLGADSLEEAEANPSAIWTGSAWHQMAQGPQVGLLVPEGSYATWYSISSTVDGGGYHLEFNPVGAQQCSGVLVRGWFAETHADRHVPIVVSNYGALGAMVYTRYPVPVEAGQFFAQDYLTAQAVNALDFDNSGIGDEDCSTFWQFVFDYNDGSLTVLKYTAEAGWELVWTNIVGHGR